MGQTWSVHDRQCVRQSVSDRQTWLVRDRQCVRQSVSGTDMVSA